MTRKRSAVTKPARPRINKQLLDALRHSLRLIQSSPRYEMVRTVSVSQLLGKAKIKDIPKLRAISSTTKGGKRKAAHKPAKARFEAGLSLEELVMLGVEGFRLLPGVNNQTIKNLLAVLRGLSTPDAAATEAAARLGAVVSFQQVGGRTLVSGSEENINLAAQTGLLPQISEIEAEQRISAALDELRKVPQSDAVLRRKLGEFWDDTWPAAPFEQAITLAQLLKVDREKLLRKRSLFGAKVTALVWAVERAGSEAALNAGVKPVMPESDAVDGVSVLNKRWQLDVGILPLRACILMKGFENALEAKIWPAGVHQMASALHQVCMEREFAELLNIIEHDAVIQRAENAGSIDLGRLREALSAVAPNCVIQIDMLLRAPAVSEQTLQAVLIDQTAESARDPLLLAVLRCIFAALGGATPVFRGRALKGFWTSNPYGIDVVLEALLAVLPLSADEFTKRLTVFMPYVSGAEVLRLLSDFVQQTDDGIYTGRQ